MELFQLVILFIMFYILFWFINRSFYESENFCYGNDYCNGNKDSALCINQSCRPCGLQSQCSKDSDCTPNNCIDGCCDNR